MQATNMAPPPGETVFLGYTSNRDIDTRPLPSKCARPNANYASGEDLPTELLQEIFLLYVNSGQQPFWLGIEGEGPLLLALVCKRWRAICFSTPDLWATFSFPLGHPGTPRSESRLKTMISKFSPWLAEIVDARIQQAHLRRLGIDNRPSKPSYLFSEWLRRSASRPLVIDVRWEEQQQADVPLLVPDAQNMLLQQAGRWQTVMMSLHGDFATAFLNLDVDAAPQLEQLVINGSMGTSPSLDFHALAHKVSSLLSLKHLDLGGQHSMTVYELESLRCLPFERLESVALSFPMRMVDAYRILQRCVSTQSIMITAIEEDSPGELQNMSPIRLPLLQYLMVGAFHVPRAIFRAMDVPKLAHLSVYVTRPFYMVHVEEWESAVRVFDKNFNLREMIADVNVPISFFSFYCKFDPARRAT